MSLNPRTEHWVNELVNRVVGGGRCEADTVDCKAQLLHPADKDEARKTARKIAGLINAARGQTALWLVGLDEDAHQIVPATGDREADLAAWWPQIERCFDASSPVDMEISRVSTDHGVITVLQFDSARPPYMVTTDGHAGIDREVPWRVGTKTRTATRAQLLSSLIDAVAVPEVEFVSPTVVYDKLGYGGSTLKLKFAAQLYFYVTTPAVLPRHLWSMTVLADEWPADDPADMKMDPQPHRSTGGYVAENGALTLSSRSGPSQRNYCPDVGVNGERIGLGSARRCSSVERAPASHRRPRRVHDGGVAHAASPQ